MRPRLREEPLHRFFFHAERAGFAQRAVDRHAHHVARAGGCDADRRITAHVGAAAGSRFDDPKVLELAHCARDRSRVDDEGAREVLDGRELLARLQDPNGDRAPHLISDLKIDGKPVAGINVKVEWHIVVLLD